MSDLSTNPATFQIAYSETLPLGVDMSALMLADETISSPSAILWDRNTDGTAYCGQASAAGSTITQTLYGGSLVPGHVYRLVVSFVAGGKHWSTETRIEVVF